MTITTQEIHARAFKRGNFSWVDLTPTNAPRMRITHQILGSMAHYHKLTFPDGSTGYTEKDFLQGAKYHEDMQVAANLGAMRGIEMAPPGFGSIEMNTPGFGNGEEDPNEGHFVWLPGELKQMVEDTRVTWAALSAAARRDNAQLPGWFGANVDRWMHWLHWYDEDSWFWQRDSGAIVPQVNDYRRLYHQSYDRLIAEGYDVSGAPHPDTLPYRQETIQIDPEGAVAAGLKYVFWGALVLGGVYVTHVGYNVWKETR